MFKEFFMKKMLKAKGVPEEQVDMVMTLVNKNPELFQKIAEEIKNEMKNGKSENDAAMSVMLRHQQEIQQLMMK